jgi:hypothetical protein
VDPLSIPQEESAILTTEIVSIDDDFLETFAEAIAIIVSCTGIRRNSTTHRLARAFPAYTQDYKRRCIRKQLQVGVACPFDLGTLFGTRIIFSLPVREHWKEVLQPPHAKAAITSLVEQCAALGLRSLAFPLFEGPPPGWIEAKLRAALANCPACQLEQLYLFKEE